MPSVYSFERIYESKIDGNIYFERFDVKDVKMSIRFPYIHLTLLINYEKYLAKASAKEFTLDSDKYVAGYVFYGGTLIMEYTLPDGRVITDEKTGTGFTKARKLPAGTHVKAVWYNVRGWVIVYVSDSLVTGAARMIRLTSTETGTEGYCDIPSVPDLKVSVGEREYSVAVDITKEGLYVKDIVAIMLNPRIVMFKIPVKYYAIGMRPISSEETATEYTITYEIKDFMGLASKVPVEVYDYDTGQVLSRRVVNVGTVKFTNTERRRIRVRGYSPEYSAVGNNKFGHGWSVYYYTKIPLLLPNPKLRRDGCKIDGKSPGTYTYNKGQTLEGTISMVNEGGMGRCRAVVYDELNKAVIFSRESDLDTGQSAFIGFRFTVDRDMNVVMYAQYYDPASGKWVKSDEYG